MLSNSVLVFIIFFFIGCSKKHPAFLPRYDEIHLNEYGSFIKVYLDEKGNSLKGELIAVENQQMVILTGNPAKCVSIPTGKIVKYNLFYANPYNYSKKATLNNLITLSHGWLFVITFPLYGLTGEILKSEAKNSYMYNMQELPVDQLYKFARYPQGIPSVLVKSNIK